MSDDDHTQLRRSHGRCIALLLMGLVGSLGAGAASADLFVCKDADGRRIIGPQPPPECSRIRGPLPDGTERPRIQPPVTPQKRAASEAEEKRLVEEALRAYFGERDR
jgi:hypothetical protein